MVAAIFDVMILLFCVSCWKGCDLLKACAPEESPNAVAAVLTHKWVLNPFSYTARGVPSAVFDAIGASLLALAWWVGLCALGLLSTISPNRTLLERTLYLLYWAFGFLSIVTVVRFARRLYLFRDKVHESHKMITGVPTLAGSNIAKALLSAAACGLGLWLFYAFTIVGM